MTARRALPEGFEEAYQELTAPTTARRALVEPDAAYALEATAVDPFRLDLGDKPVAAKTPRWQIAAGVTAASLALASVIGVPALMATSNAAQRAVPAVEQVVDVTNQLSDPKSPQELADEMAAEDARAAAAERAEQARIAEEARLAAEAKAAEEARLAEAKAAEEKAAQEKAAQEQAAQATLSRSATEERAAVNSNVAAAAPAVAAPAPQAISGSCALGPADPRVTAQTAAVYYDVCSKFAGFSSVGGWRGSNDDHGAGRALDFMISGPGGWEIANYLTANASALGIDYVIYEQKIWGTWAPYWTPMEDRGSITQNHYDHVHVSIKY